jgi:hypothetical protein
MCNSWPLIWRVRVQCENGKSRVVGSEKFKTIEQLALNFTIVDYCDIRQCVLDGPRPGFWHQKVVYEL